MVLLRCEMCIDRPVLAYLHRFVGIKLAITADARHVSSGLLGVARVVFSHLRISLKLFTTLVALKRRKAVVSRIMVLLLLLFHL